MLILLISVCVYTQVCVLFCFLERIRDLKQAKEDLNPDSPFCNNTGVMAMFSFSLLAVHNGLRLVFASQDRANSQTMSTLTATILVLWRSKSDTSWAQHHCHLGFARVTSVWELWRSQKVEEQTKGLS